MELNDIPEDVFCIIYKKIFEDVLIDIKNFNILKLKNTFISITPYYTLWEDAYCNRKSITTIMKIPRTNEICNQNNYEIVPFWNEFKKNFKISYTKSTYSLFSKI